MLNAKEDINSRYILVQLPEKLNENIEEQKESFNFCKSLNLPTNIAEIAKERIRRAAKKIKQEKPDYKGDLGFKVFKLDSSNIKRWEADFDTPWNKICLMPLITLSKTVPARMCCMNFC